MEPSRNLGSAPSPADDPYVVVTLKLRRSVFGRYCERAHLCGMLPSQMVRKILNETDERLLAEARAKPPRYPPR